MFKNSERALYETKIAQQIVRLLENVYLKRQHYDLLTNHYESWFSKMVKRISKLTNGNIQSRKYSRTGFL